MEVWQNGRKLLLHPIIFFFSYEWIVCECLFVFPVTESISWLLLDSILTIRILWAWGLVMCMKYETCERPELVSINNFSNIKEERINKLSSLWLGLILHFLLKRFPWNEKKVKYTFHTNILLPSHSIGDVYNVHC